MSLNPAFDPNRVTTETTSVTDEEYVRQIAGNQPLLSQTRVVSQTSTPAISHPVNQPVVSQPSTVIVRDNSTFDNVAPRDRVRWGPIVAGFVSALATLLVASMLGVAIGFTAAANNPSGATAAATNATSYGLGAALWAGASTLVAFFIGGFIAARTSGIRGKGNGWINGAMVWAITLPILLWLAASGLGGFVNALGFNLNGFTNSVGVTVNNAASDPALVQSAAEAARNGAWGALGALLIGLIASGIGGYVGGRDFNDVYTENDGVIRR